jgi:hypothetical protein
MRWGVKAQRESCRVGGGGGGLESERYLFLERVLVDDTPYMVLGGVR